MTDSTSSTSPPLLAGGNRYDDLRVDIGAAHRLIDAAPRQPRSIRAPAWRTFCRRAWVRGTTALGAREWLVSTGLSRAWFSEFERYWTGHLGGRPLWSVLDFFLLLHDYRKRQQFTGTLSWESPEEHVANWQAPAQLYATFNAVRICAMQPLLPWQVLARIPPNGRVLEYGCSLAPYYRCYREFLSHKGCSWVLADLPNFPFHYAKHAYRNDAECRLVTIDAAAFRDPLPDQAPFDVIIVTTVFGHLDDPLFVADYLFERLRPGGLFIFDYIRSSATGLDHPEALRRRDECLRWILDRVRVLEGDVSRPEESVGLCIAEKR